MARQLGAFWTYDYSAAEHGKPGMHALLKSGNHSDGFFVSRILLAADNIRRIIAWQMFMRLKAFFSFGPEGTIPYYVAGIPDGATMLGKEIQEIIGCKLAEMKKQDGHISLVTEIQSGARIILVEDFCTRGTGFIEAVKEVITKQPRAAIMSCDPVIINRGGLEGITVEGVGHFKILPVVEWRVQDWTPETCPLCAKGSTPIKPKATDENWLAITNSQK
jgi:orotate phosphoribosyltransferase